MAHNEHRHGANPFVIWVWLIVILVAGFVVFEMGFSTGTAVVLLFSLALIKAFLVIRHYMHMYDQPLALYAIAGIPVILMIFMVVSLLPDIAFHHIPPTTGSAPPAASPH